MDVERHHQAFDWQEERQEHHGKDDVGALEADPGEAVGGHGAERESAGDLAGGDDGRVEKCPSDPAVGEQVDEIVERGIDGDECGPGDRLEIAEYLELRLEGGGNDPGIGAEEHGEDDHQDGGAGEPGGCALQ